MAWKETRVMNERMRFIGARLESKETMSELCRQFGISRRIGYKWLNRYRAEGPGGLVDRSRAPNSHPLQSDEVTVEAVLNVRLKHPGWGPRKVKGWLEWQHPERSWPASSTIGGVFDRHGLTKVRKRARRVPPHTQPFATCRAPNDVWCADYKGWFLTGDGTQVDPLTITDAASRYLIRCEAVGRPDEAHSWPIFEAAFREFGLPRALRTDNGSPFASRAAAGLSRLSVKLIKAGVMPERIEPGKPQQNGRHERMHLTLKQETATPPAASLAEQMDRFDAFRQEFNEVRPHEALGQVPPSTCYTSSPRIFDGKLRSPEYPGETVVRVVRRNGQIKWKGDFIFISEVLHREPIGFEEIGNEVWLVKYGPVTLGILREREGFEKVAAPRSRKLPHAPRKD